MSPKDIVYVHEKDIFIQRIVGKGEILFMTFLMHTLDSIIYSATVYNLFKDVKFFIC